MKFGEPAEVILDTARERNAGLIVLGVRKPEARLGLTTHFGRDSVPDYFRGDLPRADGSWMKRPQDSGEREEVVP